MKRLILLFFIFCSVQALCGCDDCAIMRINGKFVYSASCGQSSYSNYPPNINYAVPDSNLTSRQTLINRVLYIYPGDSALIQIDGPTGELFVLTYTNGNDTIVTNRPSNVIRRAGHYNWDMDYGWCYNDMELTVEYKNVSDIDKVSANTRTRLISNPVNSFLKLYSLAVIKQLNIYDQMGKIQIQAEVNDLSNSTYEANIEALSGGVYYVEIITETDEKDFVKIIKQ